MPDFLRKSMALGLALALSLGIGAEAQEVLGRYTAMITSSDHYNSGGRPLSQPGQILAQERANYHRFGIRQPEDSSDGVFGDRTMRAALPDMLSRGEMKNDARALVMGGGLVSVEIIGRGGRPYALRVTSGTGDGPGGAPGMSSAAAQLDGRWSFIRTTGSSAAMAQTVDPVARVALECARPTSSAALSGMLTLRVVAPAAATLPTGPVALSVFVDAAMQGNLTMSAHAGVLTGTLPVGAPLVAALVSGNRLSLSTGQTPLVEAGLSGSSAALAMLMEFCATPAEAPLSAALMAAPEVQAPFAGGAAPVAGGDGAAPMAVAVAAAPAPSAPIERGLEGEEAVGSQLGIWLLGQRPSLIRNPSFNLSFPLPAGYPEYVRPVHPGRLNLQEAYEFNAMVEQTRRDYLEGIAARAASETIPEHITLKVPARLLRREPGKPNELRLAGYGKLLVNHDLQPSIPAALRTLQMDVGNKMARVFLRESAPLPLPLPDELRAMDPPPDPTGRPGNELFPADEIFLRVTLALSDPQVLLPNDVERAGINRGPAAEIRAQVLEAGLFRKPRTRSNEPPAPETLLATWRRDAATATAGSANLKTLEAFAGTYASGVEDGRLLSLSNWYLEATGAPRTLGPMGVAPDVAAHHADLIIRANAVLERTPDRAFAPDLLQMLLEQLVDPLSRDGMVPPGFFGERGSLNEITQAKILKEAQPKLADYIRARAPELPLPVRSRGIAQLGNYDIGAEVFSYALQPEELTYLPTPSRNRSLDGALDGLGDALAVPLGTAEALLTQLEQDAMPGRSVPARLDMRLVSARAVPQTGGPITLDELQRVVLTWEPETLQITADMEGRQPLMTRDFAPKATGGAEALPVPDEVYATTAETILGAWASRHGTPEELARNLASSREFRRRMGQVPQSVIDARALEEAQRVIASAPDSFWIGLAVQMGDYDAAGQRIPLSDVAVFPIPSRMGENVDGVPGLRFAKSAAFDHLPATPAEYELITSIDGPRNALLFAHVTLAEEQDRRRGLELMRPDRLLFLREDGNGGVSVVLSKQPEAAPRLGLAVPAAAAASAVPAAVAPAPADASGAAAAVPAFSGPVPAFTTPETLLLDGEGLDLLALSLQPDLYNARAFRRMLVERVALERRGQKMGNTPQWGPFFANPELELSPALVEGLLPAFAAWSAARAAALPERMRLSVGLSGPHPETGCREARPLPQSYVADRAAVAQIEQILPGAMPQAPVSPASDATKPGGPPLHVVVGRPSHPSGAGGASECDFIELRGTSSDLSTARTGIDAGAAPYVDALVLAETPLVARVTPSGPQAIDYLLSAADVSLQPLTPGSGDQPGLRGVLVIRAGVTAVETWQFDKTTRGVVRAERYEEDAWQSLLPSRDTSSYDILGLRLGAPLSEVETMVAGRMPDAVRHVSPPVAKAGIYDHALGFSGPDRREVILSIYDPSDEAKGAVALMRYRYLPPGTATVDAVRKAVTDKYGPPDRENGDALAWGVPSQELDPNEVCGGHKTLRGSNALRLAPEKTREEIIAQSSDGSYLQPEWGYYGWPSAFADYAEYQRAQAEPYCGPVVLARIRSDVYEAGSVDLTIWLLDKPEAERRAAAAAETAEAPELDMDL